MANCLKARFISMRAIKFGSVLFFLGALPCSFAQETSALPGPASATSGTPQMTQSEFQQFMKNNGGSSEQPAQAQAQAANEAAAAQVPVAAGAPNVSQFAAVAPTNTAPPTATATTTETTTTTTEMNAGSDANGVAPANGNPEAGPQQAENNQSSDNMRTRRPRTHHPLTYEESLNTMLNSVPPNSPKVNADEQYAFNALLKQNMPLSPREMVQLHQQIDIAQRAAAIPANIPPKPVSTTLMVNLAPGTTPPAIRLAQGYVSSLVFVDSTGAPWPIASFDVGNPKALTIQWDGKGNILLMQAVSPYSDGNMVIRLVGLETPITFELVSGQRVVDYRVDIHVSGLGPNTKDLPMGTALPSSANELLLGVLDGVAPAGSRELTVAGADAQAWILGEKMYLRTRLTLLSPGWVGKMVSPDGMQAYELPKTSSVLVSRYGEPAELKIEGF